MSRTQTPQFDHDEFDAFRADVADGARWQITFPSGKTDTFGIAFLAYMADKDPEMEVEEL